MKTIILAGGFGTRISEQTELIPKPMIQIGNRPILWHIMKSYSAHNFNEFYLALGYKSDVIKKFFLNYHTLSSDFSVNLSDGKINILRKENLSWKVNVIDTGLNTMTGGRMKRFKEIIPDKTFFLTYGDGVSDINLTELLKFHQSHGKIATVTAVRPTARFGELNLNDDDVESFEEKPQLQKGWINGGFFVFNREFFDFIDGDHTLLEREPLEKAANLGELKAFKHKGFWQCMDTKRDHEFLQKMYNSNNTPWLSNT